MGLAPPQGTGGGGGVSADQSFDSLTLDISNADVTLSRYAAGVLKVDAAITLDNGTLQTALLLGTSDGILRVRDPNLVGFGMLYLEGPYGAPELYLSASLGVRQQINGLYGFCVGGAATGTLASSIYSGTGSPEGVKAAAIGSLWLRQDGGTSTSVYVKESGTGNTGWVAK